MNFDHMADGEIRQFIAHANQALRVTGHSDAVQRFVGIRRKKQEHFAVCLLDGSHQHIKTTVTAVGTVNRAHVHPRDVFREAIKKNAVAIVVGHNHPSGVVTPSEQDDYLIERLVKAGEIIGITVLDSIIVSKDSSYSTLESNPALLQTSSVNAGWA